MAVSVPPDASGKLPPQNQEAETSVLGAILLSEQALDGLLIDVKLKPEDFYRERHRLIFRAMIRLKEKTDPEPVDGLTVCEELDRAGELEEAGGTAFVHSLPNLVPAAGNARHYAKIVKQHAMLRNLLGEAREIQEQVFTFTGEPRELLEQAEAKLFRIAHDDRTGELRSIEDVLHDELDKLEAISRHGIAMTGTPSGFTDIDELTGGFQPGNLIVLAARPSMGKSALVTNMAENAAVEHEKPVALFSLEMSETELAQRFIASQAKLDGDDLRKGRVRQDRWPKVVKATEKLASSPLFIDDSSRSEEHTSELQSHHDLVCRLLLEKKKQTREDMPSSKKKSTTIKTNCLKLLPFRRFLLSAPNSARGSTPTTTTMPSSRHYSTATGT